MTVPPATMQVVLMYAPQARQVHETVLDLPVGSTVAQALAAAQAWLQPFPELADAVALGAGVAMGVWGRKVTPDAVLRDRDRLEFYRPLRVDPKVARRERFSKQGARASGLFAKRRPGAKPGY